MTELGQVVFKLATIQKERYLTDYSRKQGWENQTIFCLTANNLRLFKKLVSFLSFASSRLQCSFYTYQYELTKRNTIQLTKSTCAGFVAQSCPTLHPTDCSPPVSSVHGDSPGKNIGVGCHALLQGIFPTQGSNLGLLNCRQILYHLSHQGSPRILEWVAYPFSRGSCQPWNRTGVS